MSNSYDWKNNKKIYRKSSGSKACKTPLKFLTVEGKEVALQKVANKMVAT